jgi:serine/threonine protein kinase
MTHIAPEVWNGEPYDSKADIWSLGRVLSRKFFEIQSNSSKSANGLLINSDLQSVGQMGGLAEQRDSTRMSDDGSGQIYFACPALFCIVLSASHLQIHTLCCPAILDVFDSSTVIQIFVSFSFFLCAPLLHFSGILPCIFSIFYFAFLSFRSISISVTFIHIT